MIDVQIIPATEEHLQMILPDVRQADIDELYAVSLMTTEDALRVGLRTATMALVRVRERRTGNHVWCISGVNDRWQWYAPLVGTSRIEKISEDISAPLPPCIAADAGSLSAPRKLRRRAKPCCQSMAPLAWIQA